MRTHLSPLVRRAAGVLILLALSGSPCRAQELKPIALPKPQTTGGKPLMEALNLRQTTREFSSEKLSPQTLSNLLWAAFGVNRAQGPMGRPGRTAPSAVNAQEIDIYVALPEGLYVYDGAAQLKPALAGDFRAQAGRGEAQAAAKLIYVSDYSKLSMAQGEMLTSFTNADVGFIGQNVYLFCASEGLAAHFQTPDREALGKALHLKPQQHALYVQTVGYPVKR
ncbi:MAG: SagB/ThcOx family dehydrogenase [Bryobacteraceae bacterium]|jgi:nitroreductase